VVPAKLRKRFGLEEGSIVIAEETNDGILIRPAMVVPVKRYTRSARRNSCSRTPPTRRITARRTSCTEARSQSGLDSSPAPRLENGSPVSRRQRPLLSGVPAQSWSFAALGSRRHGVVRFSLRRRSGENQSHRLRANGAGSLSSQPRCNCSPLLLDPSCAGSLCQRKMCRHGWRLSSYCDSPVNGRYLRLRP
jgi:AbrB family looped-hinge helix DNA binding protein